MQAYSDNTVTFKQIMCWLLIANSTNAYLFDCLALNASLHKLSTVFFNPISKGV